MSPRAGSRAAGPTEGRAAEPGEVRHRSDDQLLPRRPAELTAGGPSSLVTAAAVGAVAGIVAWSVAPFRAGDAFSSAGLGGMAWWIMAGLVAGLVTARIPSPGGASRLGMGPTRQAIAADPARLRHIGIGVVVATALAVVVGRAASAAFALVALVALLPVVSSAMAASIIGTAHRLRPHDPLRSDPGRAGLTPLAVSSIAAGLALGSTLGAIVGRGPSALILAVAAIVVLAMVAVRRSGRDATPPSTTAPPSAAALVLIVVGLAGALTIAAAATAPPSARAATRAAAGTTSRTVKVPANKGWVTSGITLTAGEQLKITASGSVRFIAKDKAAIADPDGLPAHYQGCGGPGFCGALVGRVAGGAPFLIGSDYTGPVGAAGLLELSANDYNPADDSGSFAAHVTTAPAGTFARSAGGSTQPLPGSVTGTGTSNSRSKGGPAVFAAFLAAIGALMGGAIGRRAATLPAGPAIYLVGHPAWEEPHGRARRTAPASASAGTPDAAAATGYRIVESDGHVTIVETHAKTRSFRIANAAPLNPDTPQVALPVSPATEVVAN